MNIHKKKRKEFNQAPMWLMVQNYSCDFALCIIWQLKTTRVHGKVESVTKQAFLSLAQVLVSSGSLYGLPPLPP